MEPTKNPINNNGQLGGNNLDPVFQGMPKPGQTLTSTPKFSNPTPPVSQTPPTPSSSTPSSPTPSSAIPSSPFSAHTPSALDRIMNPNIDKAPSVPSHNIPTQSTQQQASISPSSTVQVPNSPVSSFKPYTPPASVTQTPPVSPRPVSTPYSAQTDMSQSNMSSPSISNMANKTSTPSMSMSTPQSSVSTSVPKNSVVSNNNTAPTLGALKPTATGGHKSTIVLIISAILVLLLLGGGAYYWYITMYSPSVDVTQNGTSNQTNGAQNTNSTNKPTSSFPAGVTRPVATSSPVMSNQNGQTTKPVAKPTTPAKVTRVTTPFTETQRSIVISYIESHINALAVPKSKIPYEVTDVTFDGPDRALVEYTNGTASYTAIAVASIDTADNVRIMSFELLEK
ncbi:MAG: hypothetical protein K9M11_01970 [Candidatus Pacebacteria bacterium]|nr:hypothetical protein [Candidatus Paceibacterota bacterium]